ncbi:MAG: galactokinase [Blastocatellales bacterium]
MFIITDGTENILSDTARFLGGLEGVCGAGYLTGDREVIVTRAPGRLDLMGGIADYSGSLVLQWPISAAAHVAIQRRRDGLVRIISLGEDGGERHYEIRLDQFLAAGRPIEYEAARGIFRQNDRDHWAAYAAGSFPVLMRERGAAFPDGAEIVIRSAVPEGKGVSSSAAIEVSVMQGINVAYGLGIGARELALLCQKVENLVAGAPCGVMDQMTSACGRSGELLELLCQPGELKGNVRLPEGLSVWGIDSGIRHAVTGSDYGTVRTAAFMGYRMIAELAGLPCSADGNLVRIEDDRWNGYLANIGIEEFEKRYQSALPETMTGAEFIEKYQGTHDTVTAVDPDRSYPVLRATMHPVHENARVREFRELIGRRVSEGELRHLGELMFRSHASYTACGLGSDGTDALVRLVIEAGYESGLYGAKITGGGSGGTVAVLGLSDAEDEVYDIADRYSETTGRRALVIAGTSPGAGEFGHVTLKRQAEE